MFFCEQNRKATVVALLLLISVTEFSQTIDESQFFAYEDGIVLPKEDDTHSEQIILSPEIPFIATKYESVYVSSSTSRLLVRLRISLHFCTDQYQWLSVLYASNRLFLSSNHAGQPQWLRNRRSLLGRHWFVAQKWLHHLQVRFLCKTSSMFLSSSSSIDIRKMNSSWNKGKTGSNKGFLNPQLSNRIQFWSVRGRMFTHFMIKAIRWECASTVDRSFLWIF